jgi:site-specific DNA-adenine methylase
MFDIDNTVSEKYNILKEKVSKLDYIKSLHLKYSEAKLFKKFRPSKNTSTLPIKGISS